MRRHRRRSLQAMPFADPSSSASRALASLPEGIVGPSRGTRRVSVDSPSAAAATGARASAPQGPTTVESFIAAVWVPDTRAEKCMRCQEPFSVWRRRHHCRMCGLLCCHACSSKVRRRRRFAEACETLADDFLHWRFLSGTVGPDQRLDGPDVVGPGRPRLRPVL